MLEDMVLKKRQDYGFNGFHIPFVPRAPRSARRGPRKKKVEDSQICAFELLASLAGKLLQENESSSASSNASETNDQNTIVKMEQVENRPLKTEFLEQAESDSILEHSSAITNSDSSDKAPNFKDSIDLRKKFPVSISSGINIELPSRRDPLPIASILRRRNDSKLGIRDDDENFSRYNKLGTKPWAYRHPSRIGERRLRKLLASKYWKVSPKLKDCDFPKAAYLERGVKPFYRKRKIYHEHDKLYKRRKLSENNLVVTCDGGFSSESVCNSPRKRISTDKTCSENGGSSSNRGHQPSSQSKDSHVKFSIKSFRIPELFIEVPENATVGSLKRTVMETVTAILGGGLRVGVLLHGKKVLDDNRTLSQTGITSEENLGFTLEPSTLQAPPPVSTVDPPIPSSQLVSRSPAPHILSSGISEALPEPPLPLTNSVNNADCHKESLPNSSTDKTLSDSRALVSVPPLAVVPVNSKGRRSELVQRRTRRPFSVTEVEALVEAVEQLGTGRWRDVKLRSFENADHRTYVDLKDKWKTLVHTAKIAPQQRRGEPVPQELLDRVLEAHAYWSQNQQSKNQTPVLKAAVVV